MSSSISNALILYTAPKDPMEFIQSEVQKGVKNGTITLRQLVPTLKQLVPLPPIPSPSSRPFPCEESRGRTGNSTLLEYCHKEIAARMAKGEKPDQITINILEILAKLRIERKGLIRAGLV